MKYRYLTKDGKDEKRESLKLSELKYMLSNTKFNHRTISRELQKNERMSLEIEQKIKELKMIDKICRHTFNDHEIEYGETWCSKCGIKQE